MDFTPEQIRWIFTAMFVLVASIALHEFGHAFMATKLGDSTPRRQGRLTLNPLAHADPIGTFLLPMLGLLFTKGASTGFGWGKPVQFQSHQFTRKISMRTGEALVALAGPFMNLVLGTVVGIVHAILIGKGVTDGSHPIDRALFYAVGLNYTLMFFNLIPAPPLDGGWVAQRFIPPRHRPTWERYVTYAPFVIMAVIMIGPLAKIFVWPAMKMRDGVYNTVWAIIGR